MTVQTAQTADTATASEALLRARRDDTHIAPALVRPASRSDAYAIQYTTLATLGKIGGWPFRRRRGGNNPKKQASRLNGRARRGAE